MNVSLAQIKDRFGIKLHKYVKIVPFLHLCGTQQQNLAKGVLCRIHYGIIQLENANLVLILSLHGTKLLKTVSLVQQINLCGELSDKSVLLALFQTQYIIQLQINASHVQFKVLLSTSLQKHVSHVPFQLLCGM